LTQIVLGAGAESGHTLVLVIQTGQDNYRGLTMAQ
jgi:hypothetical protein